MSIVKPGFGSLNHIRILAINSAILGIIALGQTFVIITGGIDLSVPWTLTGAAIFLSIISANHNINLIVIVIIILICSTFIGLINGLGVAYLKIPAIIMTLGMNSILMGGLLVILHGGAGGSIPKAVQFLTLGNIKGFPVIIILWIFIILMATLLLTYSPFGKRLYAIGNNETVAIFSGIDVRLNRLLTYCISGFSAGLGGILFAGQVSNSYLGMGDPFLFQTIIVVAIGGAAITGGSGNYLGTVGGAFILTILNGLIPVFKIPTSARQIIYGLVLFAAVLINKSQSTENIKS